MDFIEAIERALGTTASKNFLPLQDGDVPATYADVSELAQWTGFKPATPVRRRRRALRRLVPRLLCNGLHEESTT